MINILLKLFCFNSILMVLKKVIFAAFLRKGQNGYPTAAMKNDGFYHNDFSGEEYE